LIPPVVFAEGGELLEIFALSLPMASSTFPNHHESSKLGQNLGLIVSPNKKGLIR